MTLERLIYGENTVSAIQYKRGLSTDYRSRCSSMTGGDIQTPRVLYIATECVFSFNTTIFRHRNKKEPLQVEVEPQGPPLSAKGPFVKFDPADFKPSGNKHKKPLDNYYI